ncbi:MAG: cytochrome c family protein, partial [Mesorhizobium sp.]
MDSFEFNKIIGAILAAIFVVFSISIVSDSLFASHAPEKPGFIVEAAEEGGSGEATAAAGPEPIGPLIATADVEAGKKLFARCAACHTDDQSGANKIGPNLWGVVDRPVAAHAGFSYSAAMKESAAANPTWSYQHLSEFILSPKAAVKGTVMNFPGLKKIEDRANLIAYLRTQADSPAALPDPAAAEAPAAGEAAPAAETPAAPAAGEAAPAAP